MGIERAPYEQRLARAVGRALNQQRAGLFAQQDRFLIPPAFWDNSRAALSEAIRPVLDDLALAAGQQLLATQPVGVEWAEMIAGVSLWSGAYADQLAAGMNQVTQRNLAQLLHSAASDKLTAQLFGPARAASIGVTETTTAISQGEVLLVRLWGQEGLSLEGFWDAQEFACRICRSRDGQRVGGIIGYPPAHNHCKCETSWKPRVEHGLHH